VPTGSMLQDTDSLEHQGESIFALNRGLYPEMNKTASILQTLNMMTFKPPLQWESQAGVGAELPDKPPYGAGAVTPVDPGMGFKPFPLADIQNATRLFYSMLDGRLQRGALPAVDYGNLSFPLSAVAISRLTESRDQIFVPRLQALSMFYQALSRMVIKQYIALGMSGDIGEEGHKRTFETGKLEGEYTIKCTYEAISSEQNIANYSIAGAARGFVSDDTIRRDILKLENPDEEQQKILSGQADKLVPTLALYKMAKSKIDQGETVEAQLIAAQLGMTLEQIKSGKLGEQKPTPTIPERKSEAPVPLLGTAGARGLPMKSSAQESQQLETQIQAGD